MKWFNHLPRLVQFILLLIPVVGWIVEIYVRVTAVLEKPTGGNILGLIFGIIIPVFSWVDLIWVLLFHHLILAS
jgi:uncharacterized membrane protein